MGKKELRETQRWFELIQRVPLIKKPELPLVPKLELGNKKQPGFFHSMFNVRCSMFDVHL